MLPELIYEMNLMQEKLLSAPNRNLSARIWGSCEFHHPRWERELWPQDPMFLMPMDEMWVDIFFSLCSLLIRGRREGCGISEPSWMGWYQQALTSRPC